MKHTSLITITKTRQNYHSLSPPLGAHTVHFSDSLPPQSCQVAPDPSDSPAIIILISNEWKRNSTLKEEDFHQEVVVSELPFSCTCSDYRPKNILL